MKSISKKIHPLHLTVAFIVLVAGVIFFGSVLEDILVVDGFARFDRPIMNIVIANRTPLITSIMTYITFIGSPAFVLMLTLFASIFLWYRTKKIHSIIFLVITVAGAGLLDVIIKLAVAHPRPPALLMLVPADGYGFPSGHTTLSVIYAGFAYLLARTHTSRIKKMITWVTALTCIFLIGISRVYLGVHWPTDVLGGWALASIWLSTVSIFDKFIERTHCSTHI